MSNRYNTINDNMMIVNYRIHIRFIEISLHNASGLIVVECK